MQLPIPGQRQRGVIKKSASDHSVSTTTYVYSSGPSLHLRLLRLLRLSLHRRRHPSVPLAYPPEDGDGWGLFGSGSRVPRRPSPGDFTANAAAELDFGDDRPRPSRS